MLSGYLQRQVHGGASHVNQRPLLILIIVVVVVVDVWTSSTYGRRRRMDVVDVWTSSTYDVMVKRNETSSDGRRSKMPQHDLPLT